MGAGAGQAAVELLALVPVLLLVAAAASAALVAWRTHDLARHAAGNGARALLQERDGEAAARSALPLELRRRASVQVVHGRVTVTLLPRLPLGVGDSLPISAAADTRGSS